MRKRTDVRWMVLALAGAVAGGCATGGAGSGAGPAGPEPGPRVVQPGAPGDASRVTTADEVAAGGRPGYTAADVTFMQEMIGHHQQALEMTALVEGRTDSRDITLLAQRIELTQVDEIELMRRWLERRGEPLPEPGAHHAAPPGTPPPYGMLTDEEMARLAAARGPEFDRLFLELMIRHHQGAVEMVNDLFASPDGGQESEVFLFASGVAADQPIEISRMQRMLGGR